MSLPADHEMVEQANVDERQSLRQLQGDVAICLARLAVAGWMVVPEYDGGRVEPQRAFDDLARVDGCAVNRPAKQRLISNQAVARVEEQAAEYLVPEIGQPGAETARGIAGLLEGPAAVDRALDGAAPELQRRLDAGDPGSAQTLGPDRTCVGAEPMQAAVSSEQRPCSCCRRRSEEQAPLCR